MFKKKLFWIILIALVLAGGGYAAYASGYLPWFGTKEVVAEETTVQTATVTQGNLSITADGTGTLMPSSEIDLSFESSGTLMELLVKVGDKVKQGDVLGWIDDTEARNQVASAELNVKQAQDALEEAGDTAALQQAVTQTELQVAQAENNLATAQQELDDLLNWAPDETEITIAEANLTVARVSYTNTVAEVNLRDEQLVSSRIDLEDAVRSLQNAQTNYVNAMDAARDWEKNIESTRENAAEALRKAQNALTMAQTNYDLDTIDSSAIDIQNARVKVLNAEQSLADLKTAPEEIEIATAKVKVQEMQIALAQAKLDLSDAQAALADVDTSEAELTLQQAKLNLEAAQKALDGATLVAPMDGTVTAINAQVGETTSGAVLTLANLDEPVIEFWVEESDMNNLAVGHPVNIVFEALPDLTFSGKITSIEPMLTTQGNTSAVQAWASIDISSNPVQLLGNMNAEVEVVAGEARNALLAPVAALRELSEGQYAVFVMKDDGELEMRMVQVGLQDYVNAEIRSGLQLGETVTLGATDTSSNSTTINDSNMQQNFGDGGMPPMMPGG